MGVPVSGREGNSVVFFPTAASRRARGGWEVPVHGWVYRGAELSRLRRLAMRVVREVVQLKWPEADFSGELFRRRLGAFLADNERGNRVEVVGSGEQFRLKRSKANGHFYGVMELGDGEVEEVLMPAGGRAGWRVFRAVARCAEGETLQGRVMMVPEEGVSVISDIDDTIKETGVLERDRMLASTFLHPFKDVAGMAGVYRKWERERGAVFHYVSASPWHLYPFLAEFLEGQGFPAGTFHLRDFRLMPLDLMRTLRKSARLKYVHCRELLRRFPRRKFVLVGDSGEGDAAMYCRLAREFGEQVERIWIRDVGRGVCCEGAPAGLVRVFREAEHLGQ